MRRAPRHLAAAALVGLALPGCVANERSTYSLLFSQLAEIESRAFVGRQPLGGRTLRFTAPDEKGRLALQVTPVASQQEGIAFANENFRGTMNDVCRRFSGESGRYHLGAYVNRPTREFGPSFSADEQSVTFSGSCNYLSVRDADGEYQPLGYDEATQLLDAFMRRNE